MTNIKMDATFAELRMKRKNYSKFRKILKDLDLERLHLSLCIN